MKHDQDTVVFLTMKVSVPHVEVALLSVLATSKQRALVDQVPQAAKLSKQPLFPWLSFCSTWFDSARSDLVSMVFHYTSWRWAGSRWSKNTLLASKHNSSISDLCFALLALFSIRVLSQKTSLQIHTQNKKAHITEPQKAKLKKRRSLCRTQASSSLSDQWRVAVPLVSAGGSRREQLPTDCHGKTSHFGAEIDMFTAFFFCSANLDLCVRWGWVFSLTFNSLIYFILLFRLIDN